MKTIKISNGDIEITPEGTTGYVEGENKSSQDIARALLCTYSPYYSEGNQLLDLAISGQPFGLSESLVTQYIAEAINRLISKQQAEGQDTRILSILDLRTRVVDLSTAVFYVECLCDNGQVAAVTNFISLEQTQLNQILNPNAILKV